MRINVHRMVAAAAVAVLGSALLLSSSGSAWADDTTAASTGMYVQHVTRVVGPDSTVSGNIIVQITDGTQITLPASEESLALKATQAAATQAHPDSTFYGNCGTSNVSMVHRSDGTPVRMTTGFHVDHEAISYVWNVIETGPSGSGYNYWYTSSGNLAFRSTWAGSHNSHKAYAHGEYKGQLLGGISNYAFLDTGDICTSSIGTTFANL